MFKDSLFSSKFRDEMATHLNELEDFEVIQLLQRDSSVKVIITQETYFALLSKAQRLNNVLEKATKESAVDHVSVSKLKERVQKKSSKLKQQEETSNVHKVGKKRIS